MKNRINRRAFIKRSLLTSAVGALALDAASGNASAQEARTVQPSPAGGTKPSNALPKGKIGNMEVSRLLLGGNLLTHFTHSRDLKYVYALAAHYNTEPKILETLALAEEQGINTVVAHTVPSILNIAKKHRNERGGRIKWILALSAPIEPDMKAYAEQVKEVVGSGIDAVYVWGVHTDQLVAAGKTDLIAKAVDVIKSQGSPSGVAAHDLKVITECEQNKINADFYIKTLHHHNYPSAPKPEQLNAAVSEIPGYWCRNPEETVQYMKGVEKPWIAFKVMAAGAISPTSAFKYAFEGGADFVLAGMFDFEIKDDVTIANDLLSRDLKRERPWRG